VESGNEKTLRPRGVPATEILSKSRHFGCRGPATAFTRNLAEIQHEVHRDTVAVTSHNRITGYFLSPEEFAEFEDLRAKSRKSLVVGQLPAESVQGLENARMDPRHADLDPLMND
jgi:hypothetical protein